MIRGFGKINRADYEHLRQPAVHRVIVVQFVVCVLLLLVLQPLGSAVSLSAFLGGLCYALPNAYFVRKAFQYQGARSAKKVAGAFYRGEAGKLLLTAAAFTLVFSLVKLLEPLSLFSGFIALLVTNCFTPLLIK